MYRLLGDNHVLDGLPFTAQVFLRALDGIRRGLADDAGVTGTELRALSRVAETSGLDIRALGDNLELSPEIVETLVGGLERRGLLAAAPPASLSSPATLTLTPSGHDLIAATYESFHRIINTAAESLDPERRMGFESGMLKMARKLDAVAEQRSLNRE